MIYGGSGYISSTMGRIPRDHNGANVYIRDRLGCCIERGASTETCNGAQALNLVSSFTCGMPICKREQTLKISN